MIDEFNRFLKDLIYGMEQRRSRVWTEGERLQHLVLIFTKYKLPRDAKYFEGKYYEWEKEKGGLDG